MLQKEKNYILLILTLMLFVTIGATDIYLPALPAMADHFHASPTLANWTLSIYTFGIALGVLAIGEVSNRFGRKKVLASALVLFTITSFTISFSPCIYFIIFLRFFQALAASAVIIVPRLILKDVMNEREQIRSNGILLIGLILSPAIAPVIGAIISSYLNWRYCFVFTALCAFLLLIAFLKWVPETLTTPLKKFDPFSTYITRYRTILSSSSFRNLTIIYSAAIGAYFSFIGASSYLYVKKWHWSELAYSTLFLLLSFAYLLGNVVMQRLNQQQKNPIHIIAWGVYSTALGALLMLIALIFYQILPLFLVIFTAGVILTRSANAIINPTTQVRMMNLFPNQFAAFSLGLNMGISFLTGSIATYLVTIFPHFPLLNFYVVAIIFITITTLTMVSGQKKLLNS